MNYYFLYVVHFSYMQELQKKGKIRYSSKRKSHTLVKAKELLLLFPIILVCFHWCLSLCNFLCLIYVSTVWIAMLQRSCKWFDSCTICLVEKCFSKLSSKEKLVHWTLIYKGQQNEAENYLQQNVIWGDIGIDKMHIGLIFPVFEYGSSELEIKRKDKETKKEISRDKSL